MKRLIYISGCDDSTSVVLDLTDEEFDVVKRLADASRVESGYGCQPVIEVATEGEKHYGWPTDEKDDE